MRQCAPDLRRLAAIHLAAGFGRVKVMTAAIGIQAQRQAIPTEHLQQRLERRIRAFFLGQKRRINLARGIVHRHHQIERRSVGQPRVPRGVLVQHHAGQRLALTLLAVFATRLGAHHQLGLLQHVLDPAVAACPPVLATVPSVKMLDVPASEACAVHSPHLQYFIDRGAPARHLRHAPVDQPLHPIGLIAGDLAPECAFAHPQQPSRIGLVQPPLLPARVAFLESHLARLL